MRPWWRALALVVALAALTAGCLGNGEVVRVEGEAASVPEPGGAGYETLESYDLTLNETITITLSGDVEGRSSQDVRARIPVRTYRGTDGSAVVAVAASPYVQVIENPPEGSDPLSERSTAALVGLLQDEYSDVGEVRETGTTTIALFGNETDLRGYETTATRDGERVDVAVSVARIRHSGDVVTVVAVYPTDADANLGALLDSLEH